MRCNGDFRFAALVAFAERAGADAPLDRALRPPRRARRPAARRARGRPGEGPVVHARDRRSRRCSSASRSRSGTRRRRAVRAEAAAAGLAAAHRRGEPGGVLPRGRRLPRVPRAAGRRRPRRGRSWTRTAASSAATTGSGGSRPASGAGSAIASRGAALRAPRGRSTANALVVGPRRLARRRRTVEARGAPLRRRRRAPRRSSATARAAVAASVTATGDGFSLELDEPVDGRRTGPGRGALRRGRGCRMRE